MLKQKARSNGNPDLGYYRGMTLKAVHRSIQRNSTDRL
jgi:hypothetical protein